MPRLAIAAALAVSLAAPAAGQEAGRTRSPARVTAAIATGTLLTPVGFFGTGWAAKRLAQRAHWPEVRASRTAYLMAYAGAAAAAAAGPALVGNGGRYPVSVLGGAAGIGVAALAARIGNARYDGGQRCSLLCWGLGALTVALPSLGATVAYEASRR